MTIECSTRNGWGIIFLSRYSSKKVMNGGQPVSKCLPLPFSASGRKKFGLYCTLSRLRDYIGRPFPSNKVSPSPLNYFTSECDILYINPTQDPRESALAIMQFNALLLLAALIGANIAAPVTQNVEGKAVINSRFATYEADKRDANTEKAVINSRFATYENEARDATDEKEAVINSRFATYEAEKRDAEKKEAAINSRFATYETEEKRDDASKKAVINSRFANYEAQ